MNHDRSHIYPGLRVICIKSADECGLGIGQPQVMAKFASESPYSYIVKTFRFPRSKA